MSELLVYNLGLIEYSLACVLQEKLQDKRIKGEVPDSLLVLEHPPILTLARKDDPKNILVSEAVLENRGLAVFPTDRGGRITYHGPGQIVGYPIMDLKDRGRDIHRYIQDLESVIMEMLGGLSISSHRDHEHVGVWVGREKIAAIGVKVKKWVTKHGFALNVNTDLSFFDLIHPCGITDKGVTSMKKMLGYEIDLEKAGGILIEKFSEVFKTDLRIMGNGDIQDLLGL